MAGPTDAQLVTRWRAGDDAARETLFARHYPSIERFFAVKVPAAAADLTQQTFLSCVELLAKLHDPERFRAFAFGVARNHLLRHVRAAAKDDARTQTYETGPGQGPTPSGVVAHHELQWLVLRALEGLPMDLRIALELHYWEAMTSTEIGDVLRVPRSTVTTRLSRARQRLLARIVELGGGRQLTPDEVERWARSLVATS